MLKIATRLGLAADFSQKKDKRNWQK